MDEPMRNFPRRCAALIANLAAHVATSMVVPVIVLLGLTAPLGLIRPALAQRVYAPRPWEMGMQPAGGPLKQQIIDLHDLVLVIITLITVFVAVLLGWVMYRYNVKRNPTPSQTSHNTVLEVAWTVIPILILVVMAIPSFGLVYYLDRTADADLTVKVTGHQWYWEYSYPDNGNIDFSSYIIPDDQLKPGQLRLLAVDNDMVVPAGKNIRVLEASGDVIHSFFVPSLGVQRYAIPGRTIETWFRVDKPGIYIGECNQICGTNHSRMPIVVRAVTPQEFAAWLVQAKAKFADAGGTASPPAAQASAGAASATSQSASAKSDTVTPAGATPSRVTPGGVAPVGVAPGGVASAGTAPAGVPGGVPTGVIGGKPFSLLAAAQVQR
jgi:cytochrome c oxidase subunit II